MHINSNLHFQYIIYLYSHNLYYNNAHLLQAYKPYLKWHSSPVIRQSFLKHKSRMQTDRVPSLSTNLWGRLPHNTWIASVAGATPIGNSIYVSLSISLCSPSPQYVPGSFPNIERKTGSCGSRAYSRNNFFFQLKPFATRACAAEK